MNLPEVLATEKPSLRFVLLGALYLGALALVFEYAQGFFATAYMLPVSSLAATLLNAVSVEAILDTAQMHLGYCEITLRQIIYRVTFDCTGIFALLLFASLTLAYPTVARRKVTAFLIGVPAIFVFSTLRLVVLGIVAYVEPGWVELFHVYVMELATLGFMLFVWKYWIDEVAHAD